MIKKFIIAVALVGVSFLSHGQGTVYFRTDNLTANTAARVFDVDGTTLLAGTSFFVQIYAGNGTITDPLSTSLVAKGTPVNFRAGGFAGYVQYSGNVGGNPVEPVVTVTTGSSGLVTIQLRAWAAGYATYEAAALAGAKTGVSPLFVTTPGYPPNATTSLEGIQGFNLQVPEPTTIALGLMGASTLLFRRRK